jgi:hypothetical protein
MDLSQIPTEFLWFITGAFTHMALSLFFGYGKVINFAQDALNQTLKLLILIMEDMAYMREIKYQHMYSAGTPEETIETCKQIDEQVFNSWKVIVIHKFVSIYPKNLRGIVKFSTWEQAANILTKEMKKRSPR